MDYSSDYDKALKYAAAVSTTEHPEIGQLFHSAVGGFSGEPDHAASLALADKLQETDDWRHHIFANPDDTGASQLLVDPAETHVVYHGQPKSVSYVRFHPDGGASIQTDIPNHNGMYGLNSHHALLNKEQYADLQKDAATDGVSFPSN